MTVASASYVDWGSMWRILVISIIAGAGLVTVFSVGLVSLSSSGYFRDTEVGSGEGPVRHNVLALALAVVCGLIVAAGAVYGIHEIFAKG